MFTQHSFNKSLKTYRLIEDFVHMGINDPEYLNEDQKTYLIFSILTDEDAIDFDDLHLMSDKTFRNIVSLFIQKPLEEVISQSLVREFIYQIYSHFENQLINAFEEAYEAKEINLRDIKRYGDPDDWRPYLGSSA